MSFLEIPSYTQSKRKRRELQFSNKIIRCHDKSLLSIITLKGTTEDEMAGWHH